MALSNYDCEGQLNLTDYLKSKVERKQIKDFTNFLNSQGRSQYQQIGDVISRAYENYKDESDMLDRITNQVSIYVLNQSMKYSDYLRSESEL